MARAQFEYDQSGNTFFYFVLSFFALVLIPATFYLWPRSKRKGDRAHGTSTECQCPPCESKRSRLQAHRPWESVKRKLIKLLFIALWATFFLLAYKVSTLEREGVEYDPYAILGIDRGSSRGQIRRAFKMLSLKYHPDKRDGNEELFVKITKAHQALTNEEARKNWEEYGNPDGPGATTFGIALPSWIVERENSVWVLAAYALVFMVALPVAVGTWWYKSIKFSGDQVLMDTSRLFQYFFSRTPNMIMKRVLMILAASMEFNKKANPEVQERESDNIEIPLLFKELTNVNEKTKEMPFCYPYATKGRTLLHAHLSRTPLPSTLEIDKVYMLKKCPQLVGEMVNTVAYIVRVAHANKGVRCPSLETVENCMKLSQMIVQALWDNKSPLLQLPHFTEDMLRHCINKKRSIRSLKDLVTLTGEERRSLFRSLSDDQYIDIVTVLSKIPYVTLDVKSEVIDDEDSCIITANALVTMTVTLTRRELSTLATDISDFTQPATISAGYAATTNEPAHEDLNHDTHLDYEQKDVEEQDSEASSQTKPCNQPVQKQQAKPKVWEKQKKKKGKGGGGGGPGGGSKKKAGAKSQYVVKKQGQQQQQQAQTPDSPSARSNKSSNKDSPLPNGEAAAVGKDKRRRDKSKPQQQQHDDDDEEGQDLSDVSDVSDEEEMCSDTEDATDKHSRSTAAAGGKGKPKDDDEEWLDKFQADIAKKERSLLEGKSKNTVPVHCPYFPDEKHEWWWLYVCDRKHRALITAPAHVTTLKTTEEVQLKFAAPPKPGLYTFSVILRSDSYQDVDIVKDIKLEVAEAKKVDMSHPQWDISSESGGDGSDQEEDGDEQLSSDYATEDDDDDSS